MAKEVWASFISGGGTTMVEMVKAIKSGEVDMTIGCIVASSNDVPGIEKALALGIPKFQIEVVDYASHKTNGKLNKQTFADELLTALTKHHVTVVTQNGWLAFTPEQVVKAYEGMIFNQHPGRVPEFGGPRMFGRRVHAATLIYDRLRGKHGYTEMVAQRVDPYAFDAGAVVLRERVPILPQDTVDTLQARGLPVEHSVQIRLLKAIAQGQVRDLSPQEPLVLAGSENETFLKWAKQAAIALYPTG